MLSKKGNDIFQKIGKAIRASHGIAMNLNRLSGIVVGDTELTRDKQRRRSLAFLLAAIAFPWVPRERSITLLGFWRHSLIVELSLDDMLKKITRAFGGAKPAKQRL
mgnify:CR=1 FL=1|jgi:hypothetical protein|tara:strand:- start:7093 stop:7410 length:318 start_codon:yes stop_codon:yes gene_type:complete